MNQESIINLLAIKLKGFQSVIDTHIFANIIYMAIYDIDDLINLMFVCKKMYNALRSLLNITEINKYDNHTQVSSYRCNGKLVPRKLMIRYTNRSIEFNCYMIGNYRLFILTDNYNYDAKLYRNNEIIDTGVKSIDLFATDDYKRLISVNNYRERYGIALRLLSSNKVINEQKKNIIQLLPIGFEICTHFNNDYIINKLIKKRTPYDRIPLYKKQMILSNVIYEIGIGNLINNLIRTIKANLKTK